MSHASGLTPWQMPNELQNSCNSLETLEKMYPLMVFNSLTRTKTRFIPANTKRVTWYQCGPTVYAESHMGHARTYVSLDVIRRITRDYLGYNVMVCQNITDIDDKIIIRSSERGIPFRDLASKYEKEFCEDMLSLGVQPPDMVTRVSEYVPEEKGFAYKSNGSVYFDTAAFEKAGHKYGKLCPEQIGNSELLAEGEGALAADSNLDKRNVSDFALWKKTKDHSDGMIEPFWESPWGNGRPGWHIECSAMSGSALKAFGEGYLDVHAGGVDLKFPHHENEIAQSEGHDSCQQWTNYWLHTGHLNIKGSKMSKSLKNFTTIREALETHTARQIRFCFILHKYNDPMDFSDNTLSQAVNYEKIFSEYFHNVKAVLRRIGGNEAQQHIGDKEVELFKVLELAKENVRIALMDDYDTPRAMGLLLELIRDCNRYIEDGNVVISLSLTAVARFITFILKTFGLIIDDSIGFSMSGLNSADGDSGASKEQVLTPVLDVLTKFREAVRIAAMNGDSKAVLAAADLLRDDILPELGVRMEDKGSGKDVVTIWKLDDPDVLRKEKAMKEDIKAAKELAKKEAAVKAQEREEKAKIDPKDMFLNQLELYSQFDSEGLPSHDKAGEPLSKGAIKKLKKDQDKQKDLFEKYMSKLSI